MVNVTESNNMTVSSVSMMTDKPRPVSNNLLLTTVGESRTLGYEVERTRTGIPVTLIWVPYAILSLVLVSLMVTSFYRFHRKHGHKYKRRREELWKQLNMGELLSPGQDRGATLPPNGGVNMRLPREEPSLSHAQPSQQQPPKASSSRGNTKSKSSQPSSSGGKRHRRPLVFTSNLNGSMVDVRCGETDSLKTFASLPPSEASESSIWTLPYKKNTVLRPPYSGKYRAAEVQDDEVFLLHQTQL